MENLNQNNQLFCQTVISEFSSEEISSSMERFEQEKMELLKKHTMVTDLATRLQHITFEDNKMLKNRVDEEFFQKLKNDPVAVLKRCDSPTFRKISNFVNEAELIFESNLTNLVTFNVKAQINNDLAVELSQLTITKYETKLAATENDSSYVERADLSALQTYLNTTVADGTTVTVRVSAIVSSNNQYGFAKFSWTKK